MTHSPVHIHILAAIICVLVGFGCSSASAGGTVSGTASYRERMALPPDAVLEVSLQDVSLADAPAVELGSLRIENPGSPPFEFEIAYDPEAIDEQTQWTVFEPNDPRLRRQVDRVVRAHLLGLWRDGMLDGARSAWPVEFVPGPHDVRLQPIRLLTPGRQVERTCRLLERCRQPAEDAVALRE